MFTSSKIVLPAEIVTSSPTCGTLPPQVSGSDHKSAPVIDEALEEEDLEELDELDIRDELEESDEREEDDEELMITSELICEETLEETEMLVCTDELIATLESLDDEFIGDCTLDCDEELATNEALEL